MMALPVQLQDRSFLALWYYGVYYTDTALYYTDTALSCEGEPIVEGTVH